MCNKGHVQRMAFHSGFEPSPTSARLLVLYYLILIFAVSDVICVQLSLSCLCSVFTNPNFCAITFMVLCQSDLGTELQGLLAWGQVFSVKNIKLNIWRKSKFYFITFFFGSHIDSLMFFWGKADSNPEINDLKTFSYNESKNNWPHHEQVCKKGLNA